MSAPRKGVTPTLLRQAAKDLNLTVAEIATGTGLSKAYISEFRNETRNLSGSQQAQLLAYLEIKYDDAGVDFPVEEDTKPQELIQGLGNVATQVFRPALLLSDEVPKAQRDKLLDLIESNRIKATEILSTDYGTGGFFGGALTDETDNAIRELFALLALNYVALLMLQGRNIAYKMPADYAPKTVGEWLSKYLGESPLAEMLVPDAAVKTGRDGV